jgi:hypothetical protein
MEENNMQETHNPVATVYHRIRVGGVQDYLKVARVRSGDLTEVFKVTQHVDGLTEAEKSLVSWIRPARSTSVGDVVVLHFGSVSSAYRCDRFGWTYLPDF